MKATISFFQVASQVSSASNKLLPKHYWSDKRNQLQFLSSLTSKLNIKKQSDWGNVTISDFKNAGGTKLLRRYRGSLLKLLKSVYKESEWKKEWFRTHSVPSSHWKSMENRRKFLEEMKLKFNIEEPGDWGKVSIQDFREENGASLLSYYKNSLYSCLKHIYKDVEWKQEWFPNRKIFPKMFWKTQENRRKFLDDLKTEFDIQEPKDWGRVKIKEFRKRGGSYLLHLYKNSLFQCLKSVYKDIEWRREWFPRIPIGAKFWMSLENRRKFLDEIKLNFDIKQPSDWGKLTYKDFINTGGRTLLGYYDHSFYKCLTTIYSDISWKKEWFRHHEFSQTHWKSIENRKKFLDEIKEELGIKEPRDWGKITIAKFHSVNGGSLLRYYNGSLYRCLRSSYTEIDWKPEWFPALRKFPQKFWRSPENRRTLLDEMKRKLEIKEPSDWGKITADEFITAGGGYILHHYGDSLFECLKSIYSEIEWKREWFPNISLFPKSHWRSLDNCREFLDNIAMEYNIQNTSDWKKVTLSLIETKGGRGLLRQYSRSLLSALKAVYPSINWEESLVLQKNNSYFMLEDFFRNKLK